MEKKKITRDMLVNSLNEGKFKFEEEQNLIKQKKIEGCNDEIYQGLSSLIRRRKEGDELALGTFDRRYCYSSRSMTEKTRNSYCDLLKKKVVELVNSGVYENVPIKYEQIENLNNVQQCYVKIGGI